MPKFIIKETQYKKLLETGSASAAMDLDMYVQPVEHDTSAGNEGIEDTINEITLRLNELNSAFKTGKKISQEQKFKFHEILDELKKLFFTTTGM